MLDRVISAVYDAAEQGKFKAQHKMAEWLGCPIDDLYAVLEAMGHKKVYDPADEKKEEEAATSGETGDASGVSGAPEIAGDVQAEMAEGLAKQDEKAEEAPAENTNALEDTPVVSVAPAAADVKAEGEAPAKPEEQKKPELATFRLKKGKANTKPYSGAAKPFQKKPQVGQGSKPQDGEKKDRSKGKRERRGNPKGKEYKKQTMTAEAKAKDDSPFAILEQLKKNADGKG
jgi:hypothetical protein